MQCVLPCVCAFEGGGSGNKLNKEERGGGKRLEESKEDKLGIYTGATQVMEMCKGGLQSLTLARGQTLGRCNLEPKSPKSSSLSMGACRVAYHSDSRVTVA